ncbi:unnamed protein product [Pipistrellus nathusii]|uniref:Uncharacterized protein n=1 Tax=Pipistrellus nathusii TaxID=59473 RepID=A0ABN9ZDT3_PIPNA
MREVWEAGPVGGARGPEKLALESGAGVAAPARAARRRVSDRARPQGWASGCEVRVRPWPRWLSPAGNAGPRGRAAAGRMGGAAVSTGTRPPWSGIRAPRRRVTGGGAGARGRLRCPG